MDSRVHVTGAMIHIICNL